MTELFRYIEQAFVIPSATPAIDVERKSDLQDGLRNAISRQLPPDRVRGLADDFILKHFSSPVTDPFQLGKQFLSLRSKVFLLTSHTTHAVEQLISGVFGSDARAIVKSTAFLADKALLDDALVSVKIVTAFDRVNATELVAMRQAVAFLDDFASGTVTDVSAEAIRTSFRRPVRIPSAFVKSLTLVSNRPEPHPGPDPAEDAAARQRVVLMAEQRNLKIAYETIMGLQPDQFELKSSRINPDRSVVTAKESGGDRFGSDMSGSNLSERLRPESTTGVGSSDPTFLAVPQAAIERLGGDVRQTLEKAYIDVSAAPVSHVITAIKRRWQDVSRQLASYQVPAPAKVFRVGVHLFAVRHLASTTVPGTKESLWV